MSRRIGPMLVATVTSLLLAAGVPADAANSGQGQGKGRIQPFVELQASDGSIASFDVEPSSSDPGPRAYSTEDGLAFNGRWTNSKHVVLLDISSATNGAGASTVAVQGATSTIARWVHILQDDGSTFGTVQKTGTYDATTGSYTPPAGVSQDSQGSVVLTAYGTGSPVDGGTPTTFYWIYDSGTGAYWFDLERDMSDGDGEVKVYPVTSDLKRSYLFSHGTLDYAVSNVGDAGGGYVPTLNLGWYRVPSAAGGHNFKVYALLDFPSGAPPDTYSYTVRGTIHSLK